MCTETAHESLPFVVAVTDSGDLAALVSIALTVKYAVRVTTVSTSALKVACKTIPGAYPANTGRTAIDELVTL
jgi:hypothetical protein